MTGDEMAEVTAEVTADDTLLLLQFGPILGRFLILGRLRTRLPLRSAVSAEPR
jgi:hypothetical protein